MSTHPITNNKNPRHERLEARVNQELKLRLQYAADLQGSSLSEFLLRSAEKAANEIIHEQSIVKLAADDSRVFVDALLNPHKPNRKLRSAFLNYQKEVSSKP